MKESKAVETSYNQIVSDALRSLLYEVSVHPKPGLVDPISPGPHPDMTVFTFIDSSVSLRNYFAACVKEGQVFTGSDLKALFKNIRPIGVEAEKVMFQATHGVNTHKGAVFSLGILTTAEAYRLSSESDESLMNIVREMLHGLTDNDFKNVHRKTRDELTAGEREYLDYGVKGIRGEAEAGFPVVMTYALPILERSTAPINESLLDVLMSIVGHSIDTNLIKRAGSVDIIDWVKAQATQYFKLGGSATPQGMRFLEELNQIFLAKNLSLGGSADLLILTIFMGLRKNII
ncbi:triphosphoribosyl-dephospho-CoA synthase CitG [Secundilactobacillus malefermentans]|uniref:Probable 2-(5''-triphosphoribosyl)-3'-dephosphocoenzyme-A synthase n=1 Tax=Secundilactobacillus malefermentans TaxID=176292 RepID=A0A4R5NSK8_9LACO|nr:triphosphoribosyl-dephospho-CoA synthase CitG [Secundilactobacillus malefermentans]KRM58058.1 triphosphoribosyl-dephospho-CoA synthase [Secundilactobacillus malefermentans DSM 5705 = KCTC 3548]QEA31343.1 triphosphoribosyl-dephospho-CoA synthase CitG [Secundilactobacillus malefermentans]TDG80204.1 hypothetical protein C5L31_001814 [Secundilactobacillus malefermentans]